MWSQNSTDVQSAPRKYWWSGTYRHRGSAAAEVRKKDTEAIKRGQRRPGISRATIDSVRAPGSFSNVQTIALETQRAARNPGFVQPDTSSGETPNTARRSFGNVNLSAGRA
jgi:hypothetical protein